MGLFFLYDLTGLDKINVHRISYRKIHHKGVKYTHSIKSEATLL